MQSLDYQGQNLENVSKIQLENSKYFSYQMPLE